MLNMGEYMAKKEAISFNTAKVSKFTDLFSMKTSRGVPVHNHSLHI
jgi:hypothetical protein